jgi:hypothetical protein
MSKVRILAFSFLAFGLLLHTYTSTVEATSFHVGFWLWSLSPYIVAGVLLFQFRLPHASAGALVLPIIMDTGTFYSVFISPEGSTAALGLLIMPLWNLIIFVPAGGLLGWRLDKRLQKDAL